MAAPPPASAAPGSPPPAQVVGNAFVQQYYNILHQSPDLVFRFYQEASRLGRPAGAGDEMDAVTTMEAINEKIMSMDIARAEIRAVDAQESLCGGVTVLVTGHLTGRDDVRREFAQSFFLAPQEKGYFVLNDILRYVGEGEADPSHPPPQLQQPAPEVDAVVTPDAVLPNGTVCGNTESTPHEQEASPQLEQDVAESAPHLPEEDANEEVYDPPIDAEDPVVEEPTVAEVTVVLPVVEETPIAAPVPHEAPKKSYASIVKVMKEGPPPTSMIPSRHAPPSKPEKQAPPAPATAPVAEVPAFSPNPESNNIQGPEVDAHAIYIRNLPLNATNEQLEEQFKRFGTIKRDGIQVRSHKIQGFCYGFVEFEDACSVQSAKAASPMTIGDRQCYVEEKRTHGSRGSSRGRFSQGRGGNFRSEGIRGRGNYTGGRNFGRGGEFNYRPDFGGRGGGRGGGSSRGEFAYQQWVDNSGGRGARGTNVAPSK